MPGGESEEDISCSLLVQSSMLCMPDSHGMVGNHPSVQRAKAFKSQLCPEVLNSNLIEFVTYKTYNDNEKASTPRSSDRVPRIRS